MTLLVSETLSWSFRHVKKSAAYLTFLAFFIDSSIFMTLMSLDVNSLIFCKIHFIVLPTLSESLGTWLTVFRLFRLCVRFTKIIAQRCGVENRIGIFL